MQITSGTRVLPAHGGEGRLEQAPIGTADSGGPFRAHRALAAKGRASGARNTSGGSRRVPRQLHVGVPRTAPGTHGGRPTRIFALDLLFFHRGLNCLVAIELKVGRFEPEYLGELNFYLETLDRDVRKPHEHPTLGLLLCASKDDEVVE